MCFTEMPLHSLALYAQDRKETRCTPYGIAVLKRELFGAGGRPVIYGLSSRRDSAFVENTRCRRILTESALPLSEQYRFVTYDPCRPQSPLDWTHEREWRWAPDFTNETHLMWLEGDHELVDQSPALALFRGLDDGGHFSRVAILVKTEQEASEVVEILETCRDSLENDLCERYEPKVLARAFVVVMDMVLEEVQNRGNTKAIRLDTLPASLKVRLSKPSVSPADVERVRQAVIKAKTMAAKAVEEHKLKSPEFEKDVCGTACVITYDAGSVVTQSMLAAGLAHASAGKHYIVDLQFQIDTQAMNVYEAAAKAAAESLAEELGQEFFVHTRMDLLLRRSVR